MSLPSVALRKEKTRATLKTITNLQANHSKPTYAQVTIGTLPQKPCQGTPSLAFRQFSQQATLKAIDEYHQLETTQQSNIYSATGTQEFKEQLKTASKDNKMVNPLLQGHTAEQPFRAPVFTPQPPSEEEWKTVNRRRKAQNKAQQSKHINPMLQKRLQELKENGKCFKCLEKGHTQALCRNAIKCYKCSKYGHISARCRVIRAQTKDTTNRGNTVHSQHIYTSQCQQLHHQQPPKKQPLPQPQTDPMENWQTMPMMHPDRIQHRRTDIMRVFVANREGLHTTNRGLERAAVVHFGPNVSERSAQHRLANTLAAHLNCHPKDFLIGKADPGEGDMMVVFPTETMRNHAVHVGVFAIDHDSHVQLAKWKQSERMVYDPTTHKARLTLENVPYNNWNMESLEQLLSGVGHVLKMAPVMVNGNFDTLQVLVACHNPVFIPPTLLMTTHPFSTTVYINLEGWLHVPSGTLPPPRGDQIFRNHPRRDNRPPSPRARRQPSESSEYSRAITDEYQMGADSTYSRRTQQLQQEITMAALDTPLEGQNGDQLTENKRKSVILVQRDGTALLPLPEQVPKVLVKESLNRVSLHVQKGDIEINISFQKPTQDSNKEGYSWSALAYNKFGLLQEGKKTCCITELEETGGPVFEAESPTVKEISSPVPSFQEIGGPIIILEAESPTVILDLSREEHQPTILLNSTGYQHTTATAQQTEDGPPPGFAGRTIIKEIRRSPRLMRKNEGRYTSPENKARRVLGYEEVPTRPKTIKRKTAGSEETKITYMQEFEPLSVFQAEAVIGAAGVELDEKMQEGLRTIFNTSTTAMEPVSQQG